MQQPFVPAHWSPRLQRQGSARSASSSASARPYRSAPWSRGPRLGANTATSWNASAAPVLGPLDIDFGSALAPGHVAGAWEVPAWTPPGDRSWGQLVQPAAGTAGEAAGYPHKTGLKRARGQYEDFLADEALRFGSSTGEDGDGDDNGDGDDSSSPSGGEDAEDCESNEDGDALSFRTRALALLESLPENALSAQHAGNLLSLGREHAGARHQTQTVFTERPLVGAVPWAVYYEANACSRPYVDPPPLHLRFHWQALVSDAHPSVELYLRLQVRSRPTERPVAQLRGGDWCQGTVQFTRHGPAPLWRRAPWRKGETTVPRVFVQARGRC